MKFPGRYLADRPYISWFLQGNHNDIIHHGLPHSSRTSVKSVGNIL